MRYSYNSAESFFSNSGEKYLENILLIIMLFDFEPLSFRDGNYYG